MRFVFIMDPVSTIDVDADTSFAIMLEAERRGHRVDHCLPVDVRLDEGRVLATVRRANMKRDPVEPVRLGASEVVALEDVDCVFVRKDPPFDDAYLWLTLVLEHVRGRTLVMNDPQGLRNANEKLYACRFPTVTPRTLVAGDKASIFAFVDSVGGEAVIKPIDGHGGEGIFQLRRGDKNANAIVETVTRGCTRIAMVQEFLPAYVRGDKRILLVEGEPIGAILRVPRADEARSNIHVGGSVVLSEIDDDDRRIVDAVRDTLVREGLFFVGLDVIGGKLTEVNVTSPTGIQQMSRLTGTVVEGRVVDFVEKRAKAIRGGGVTTGRP
jgi:glutathione synthase